MNMEKFFKFFKKTLFYFFGGISLFMILAFLEIYVGDWAKIAFLGGAVFFLIRKDIKKMKSENLKKVD